MCPSIRKTAKKIVIMVLVCVFLCIFSASAEKLFTDAESKAVWVVENYTDSSMTDEEKALALHDWLVLNAYYDTTMATPNSHEAAGVLLDGTGVCDSYSKAYMLLLSKAGIESKRVTGNAVTSEGKLESHAWNLVKLAGKWYQVDVTWDDPVDPNHLTEKVSGLEHRLYFKASKRFMNEEHRPDPESAALIDQLMEDDAGSEETLPAGVDHSKSYDLPQVHLISTSGAGVTGETMRGKDMILVYGRIACVNTRAFLSNISPFMDLLKRRNVQVTVALYDDPSGNEMREFAEMYPGIVCTKVATDDYSMWEGLDAFGNGGTSVVFPVIFLKNRNNKLTYYSTNYVEHSLAVVSGALDMAGEEQLPDVSSLHHDDDGVIRLYENGQPSNASGFYPYGGGSFYVAFGVLDTTANGLVKDDNNPSDWYFCANGQVQQQYSGLAEYDGEWFYLENGKLNTTRAGLVEYDGGRFMIAAGRILREVDGLIQEPNTGVWYYVSAGQVADYTGLAMYDGAWFYVIDGRLATEFTGYVEYDGATFYVVGGQVVEEPVSLRTSAAPQEDPAIIETTSEAESETETEPEADTAQAEAPETEQAIENNVAQIVEPEAETVPEAAVTEAEEPAEQAIENNVAQIVEPEAETVPELDVTEAEEPAEQAIENNVAQIVEPEAETVPEAAVTDAEEPEKQAEPVYNAEKVNELVQRCYRTILGREGSAEEVSGWATQVTNGKKTPAQVIRGFLSSEEFKGKNLDNETLVKILYRAYMNREADPEGLAMWTTKLDEGVALNYIIKEFERSPEFRSIVNRMK